MSYDVKPYVDLLKKLSPQSQRLTLDSRTLGAGDVFLAIPGLRVDGRDFLEAASQKAAAVVYEDDGIRRTFGVPAIAVPELKAHLGEFAAHFYGDASRFLRGIAMTGTNGKTTSSHWISQLFSMLGEHCAAIGTIGCMMQGKPFKSASLT
ncbi:MAG: UDP-N-acetylmuramoyl-L-alanyl-D-glutamate--2,6-diaminopimelate ligase, partial [Burkholderiaceae bacterium]|nr:UDP-N-acetylmuramoyl-L-alanyl-D-glutamate--2,6-diaminopimelate ligase [Burkholderiaceae bacterium]